MQRFQCMCSFCPHKFLSGIVFQNQARDMPHVVLLCHVMPAVHILAPERVQIDSRLLCKLLRCLFGGFARRAKCAVEE